MSTAIEFNHVGKQYRLGLVSTGTIAHDLNRWWQTSILRREDPYLKIGSVNDRAQKADSEYVWALRDIDFKVEQGDVVGIIGKNGAGKSTLLKLLSKVTAPTTGTIRARGRIASLLEVGTGFHGEMTGRENIYMNGAILGMTKQEIAAKLDEIVAFSGCERYIDTPVKRYSSGMMVRLGFAVAAHLDPEILVVDEVLAVGDAEFQKKAIGKMQDVSKGEGRTVLFVSHNMASVRQLCNTGILLEQGQVKFTGSVDDVVDRYLSEQLSGDNVERYGNGNARFEDWCVGQDRIFMGDDLDINFKLKVNKDCFGDFHVNMNIFNQLGERCVHTSNFDGADGPLQIKAKAGDVLEITNTLRNVTLAPGRYYITPWCGSGSEAYDCVHQCMSFAVEQGNKVIMRPFPYQPQYKFVLPNSWTLR